MTNDENPIIETESFERSGLPPEEVLALLRTRVMQGGHRTLKQEYGSPSRGVATGLDAAFILDQDTYEALVQADPSSKALLKPYADAESIIRWRAEPQARWLIHTPHGAVNIDQYPAVKQHLQRFKSELEQRGSAQQWFELAQGHHVDPGHVADIKIVYRSSSDWPGFTLDQGGVYYPDASYYLPRGDYFLAGLLNSKIYWFLLKGLAGHRENGVMDLQPEHIEALPIPVPLVEHKSMIGQFSEYLYRTVDDRHDYYRHVQQEIAKNLTPGGTVGELGEVLQRWHILDVDTVRREAKRLFNRDIAADQVQMWEAFLSEACYQFNQINADIARAESKLDLVVYEMFELNEEEIEYLDRT